jgi:hypothetical protein
VLSCHHNAAYKQGKVSNRGLSMLLATNVASYQNRKADIKRLAAYTMQAKKRC